MDTPPDPPDDAFEHWRFSRSDLALLRQSTRTPWGVPDRAKNEILYRLLKYVAQNPDLPLAKLQSIADTFDRFDTTDLAAEKVRLMRLKIAPPKETQARDAWSSCSQKSSARLVLTHLRDRPADFQRLILGRDLWSKQIAVCDAVAKSRSPSCRRGVRWARAFCWRGSCSGGSTPGPTSLVITTGPDHRQVVSVLWKEIADAATVRGQGSACELGCGPPLRGLHLAPAAHREDGDRAGERWASRRSTRRASAASMPASCWSSSTRPAASPPPIWSAIHGLAAIAPGRGRQPDPVRLPLPRAPRPGRQGLDDHHHGRRSRASESPDAEQRRSRPSAWPRGRS